MKTTKSIKLSDYELSLLERFMTINKIKSFSEAIRECIYRTTDRSRLDVIADEIDNKLNRLLHNQYLIKKIQDQFFANFGFGNNEDVEEDEILKEAYRKYDKYKSLNNFLK